MGANKQGRCGNCNSENIEYGASIYEGDYIWFKYDCDDCGSKGKEYYNLKFDMNEITEVSDFKHNSYILYPSCSEESINPKNRKFFEREELQKILGGYIITCKGIYGELILYNMDGDHIGLEYNNPASNKTRGVHIYGKAIVINNKKLYR
jgi:hypothetical protein